MNRHKYYGKLFEQLQFPTKEEQFDKLPTVLTEQDVPPLANIINFLNHKDKDIFFLIFVSNKTQTDLVRLLRRSQPSLSYDIKRIKERIQFICYLHRTFPVFIEWLETRAWKQLEPIQVMILTLMFFTTSFSQSARVSAIKPTKVRYIFNKARKRLQDSEPELYHIFTTIRNNLNLVKRVYLRGDHYWDEDVAHA